MVYASVTGIGEASVEQYESAREIGRLVAERDGAVVCGGRGGRVVGMAFVYHLPGGE